MAMHILGMAGNRHSRTGIRLDRPRHGKRRHKATLRRDFKSRRDWFRNEKTLVDQAKRQLEAAKGLPVVWFFNDEKSKNAFEKLFTAQKIPIKTEHKKVDKGVDDPSIEFKLLEMEKPVKHKNKVNQHEKKLHI